MGCGDGKEKGKERGMEESTYIELVIRVCSPVCWVFRLLVLRRARGRLIEISSRQPPLIFRIRFRV